MELLKLSKFKLQLQALVTEARGLRERESSASQHCHLLIQRQKQTEEEYGRRLQELQAELAASNELRQKLERKVNYLENDNVLLENKQKELKGTLQSLLQSREGFLNAYQERTCEMKRAIEARDRKINVLLEKINSHLSLFDSIEKEALSVKAVVDNVQLALSEKEEVVAGLRGKMDKISTFEELIVDKLRNLENKLKQNADELQRKDRIISELDAQLEAAKISNGCQTPMEDLQKNLLAKDALVQNLTAEKEALYCEVGSLTTILQKIQETVMNMNKEDKRAFSLVLEYQEDCDMVAVAAVRVTRGQDVIQRSEISPHNASNADVAEHQGEEHNRVGSPLQDINQVNPCVLEFTYSPPLSPCSELQTAANDPSISVTNEKLNSTITQRHLDSECSTSQAESSEDPG